MKRLLLSLLLLTIFSCEYFDKQKVYSEDLLEEELKTFSWNDVDEYPTFSTCDSSLVKAHKRQCFETTLREYLNTKLSSQSIVVSKPIEDTVYMNLQVDKEGHFSVISIESSTNIKQEIPKLDSLLRRVFDSLPKIYPAIKRSQQVTTQFKLPVVIRIEQ